MTAYADIAIFPSPTDDIAEAQSMADRVSWYTPAQYVALFDSEPTLLGFEYAHAELVGAVPTVELP